LSPVFLTSSTSRSHADHQLVSGRRDNSGGELSHLSLFHNSRRSDSGARAKKKASEKAGKNEGRLGKRTRTSTVSPRFSRSFVRFIFRSRSTILTPGTGYLTSADRVTPAGGTTCPHINTLGRWSSAKPQSKSISISSNPISLNVAYRKQYQEGM